MINELFTLSGRVALITGGSKGLGKAIARLYAEAGADIAICSRSEEELKQAAIEISEGLDIRCEYRVTDMTIRADVDALAEWALQSFGKVDVLVNNAGSNEPQALVDTTDESWDRIVELDLTSCMRLARSVAPKMIEQGWGRIIHMSSILGLTSIADRGVYSSTKAALIGMSRAHAMELGPHGVTVNCIAPGPIMTDLPMHFFSDERKKKIAAAAALKCWGDPIDVAGPALMLASEAGRYITGAVIVVDGGVICRAFE
jgi:NAD(P)-dependent dehydrogenase (short-subunit alcohol dehydrogenase family)